MKMPIFDRLRETHTWREDLAVAPDFIRLRLRPAFGGSMLRSAFLSAGLTVLLITAAPGPLCVPAMAFVPIGLCALLLLSVPMTIPFGKSSEKNG